MDKYVVWHIQGGLGKNVAATGLCKTIKETYPDRKLILSVSWPEVFLNNPYVDRVYPLGNSPYFYEDYIHEKDTLIFRHEPYHQTGHILKKQHLIKSWCELLDIPFENQKPEVYINWAQRGTVNFWKREKPVLLIQTNGGPLTGQNYPYTWTRDMPPEVGMAIAEAFQKDYHIIQVCREDSVKIPGAEHVFAAMPNIQLFGLVVAAEKRILIDSSLQHAAAAFDKPSTVLWIGTSPTVFGYELHNNIVANPPKGNTKLIGAYLYDYQFTGELHECPYTDIQEMFDINKILKEIDTK